MNALVIIGGLVVASAIGFGVYQVILTIIRDRCDAAKYRQLKGKDDV